MPNNFFKKIFYLFLPIFLGSIIGLIIAPFMDYGLLVKPVLSPPGFIFPIAWSIIYLLLGLSYFLYQNSNGNNNTLNKIYYISLAINLLWSIFFFVFKWRLFTIFWTIILLGSVIYLLILFFKEYMLSFYLNIPYLLWLIFATYLTIGVYVLN